ncbi:MAG: hypothetical protein ACR2IE_03440 [Candidatus Sumerlaeaceae bacterium]
MWRSLRDKLPLFIGAGVVTALFFLGVLEWDKTVGWVRHYIFRVKGVAQNIGKSPPPGDLNAARACRENLHRMQAAKRKAAFDRGQQVGPISWEEVLRRLPDIPQRRLHPAELEKFTPKCPARGTYSLGNLEEVPRCTVSGQNTLTLEDDHIIVD